MQTKQCSSESLTKIISLIEGGCNLIDGPWIAGGTPRRLWFSEDWYAHDVDFFFSNEESFAIADNRFKAYAKERFTIDGCDVLQKAHSSANAITYSIQISSLVIKVQLVRYNFFKNIQEIFDDFDLNASQFITDGTSIVATDEAVRDCETKILRINPKSTRPMKAIRVFKYSRYGFDLETNIVEELIRQFTTKTMDLNDEY